MPGHFDEDRNKLFIPESTRKPLACPKCGSQNYSGRRVMGVVTFRCKKPGCLGEWYGGLPQEPADPRVPTPPIAPKDLPRVDFVKDAKGEFQEIRRRTNLVQEFRKGAPIEGDD